MEISPGPWDSISGQQRNLDSSYNIYPDQWWPSYPTPADWLYALFVSTEVGNYNWSYYSNPKYDELVFTGMGLEGIDRDQAIAAYHEAQNILVEDAVSIFTLDKRTARVLNKSVKGLDYNPAYNTVIVYPLYPE